MPSESHQLSVVPMLVSIIGCVLPITIVISLLRITDVRCEVYSGTACPPAVTSSLQALKEKQLLLSNHTTSAQQLLVAHNSFFLHQIEKKLPGTLTVVVKPQTTVMGLKLLGSSDQIYVTDNLTLLKEVAEQPQWQVVVTPELWSQLAQQSSLGATLYADLSAFLRNLSDANVNTKAVLLLDSQTVAVYTQEGIPVVFTLSEPEVSVVRLHYVIQYLGTASTENRPLEVDARFKLPVLKPTASIPRHESL